MKLRECDAEANHTPNTVHGLLERIQREFPENVAMAIKRNGDWVKWTYREYWDQSRAAAKSFLKVRYSLLTKKTISDQQGKNTQAMSDLAHNSPRRTYAILKQLHT